MLLIVENVIKLATFLVLIQMMLQR